MKNSSVGTANMVEKTTEPLRPFAKFPYQDILTPLQHLHMIRIPLQHCPAPLQILSVIVSSLDAVLIYMSKLNFNPGRVVTLFMQDITHGVAESVAGCPAIITNAFNIVDRKRFGCLFRFHYLRHTRASWLVQSDVPLSILQEMGEWESIEMVRRYAHLAPNHLSEHACIIDELFEGNDTNTAPYRVITCDLRFRRE